MSNKIVVCIGNDLVADDGVGHVIYHILVEGGIPEDTTIKLLGLGGMDLLDHIHGEELLVVVDAVQLGGDAGTVHVLEWQDIPTLELRPVSGHGIGIREAIHVAGRLYPETVPKRIFLVGVEGQCFNQLGKGLSPAVKKSVPDAVSRIRQLLAE